MCVYVSTEIKITVVCLCMNCMENYTVVCLNSNYSRCCVSTAKKSQLCMCLLQQMLLCMSGAISVAACRLTASKVAVVCVCVFTVI